MLILFLLILDTRIFIILNIIRGEELMNSTLQLLNREGKICSYKLKCEKESLFRN